MDYVLEVVPGDKAPLQMSSVNKATTTTQQLDDDDEDNREGPVGLELVNGPNTWLPAYGFQLHYQQSHEDLRANG